MSSLQQIISKFLAERANFITAIENCPASNMEDYRRWQGHAEARRVLSQDLDAAGIDLTVAPPRREDVVKAEALRDAARDQREIARNSRTRDGAAEAESIADWLDERADLLEPPIAANHWGLAMGATPVNALPTFAPTAFDYAHGCRCPHCDCGCDTCNGITATWWTFGELITDRHIALPAAMFEPKPSIVAVHGGRPEFVELLKSSYSDQPSTEHFHPRYLDPLEAAGLQIRPRTTELDDKRLHRIHGILQDSQVIGLLMPLNEPKPPCRMAS